MEFDKTKVFTTFNCDEVRVGSKGYFADSKESLVTKVNLEDKDYCCTLSRIDAKDDLPFQLGVGGFFRYFYLVEEPKEKTKRPCTREELIEMLKKQGLPMLKEKNSKGNYTVIIRSFTDTEITLGYGACYTQYEKLCEDYTLLDGTELWVED